MTNFKPALIVLLAVFAMAKLIVETESFLGKRIKSENEKV